LLSQNYEFSHLFSEYLIGAVVETPRRKFLVNNAVTALSAGGLVLNSQGQAIGVTLNQTFDFSFTTPGDFEDFHKDYLEIAPSEWFLESIANPPTLQDNEAIQRSWLGIRMQGLNEELQKYWKVPQAGGVVINEIYPESPAERAKLKQGDVILAVDDSVLLVKDDDQTAKLRNLVREYPPDTKLKM
jgi:S1-C subfamily serine protease